MLTLVIQDGMVTAADRAARKMVGRSISHVLALADRAGWRLDISDGEREQIGDARPSQSG